jgi:hypothetical protein
VPGFPAEYRPYFGNGRGGVQRSDAVQADPSCIAKAKAHSPYRTDGPGGAGASKGSGHCRVPGGRVKRGAGGVRLGMKRGAARAKLGQATTESARYMTWCMSGGGRLVAAFDRSGATGRAVVVLTDAPPFDSAGIRTGSKAARARRRLHGETEIAPRVLAVRRKRDVLVAGLAHGHVAFLASVARRISGRRTARFVAKAR